MSTLSFPIEFLSGRSSEAGGYLGSGSLTGGDVTAITEEDDPVNTGQKRVTSLTRNGVVWTRAYNLDGSPASDTALAGALVQTFNTTTGGFTYMSGHYDVNDAPRVSWTEAADIGDDIVAGTFVAGTHFLNGFRLYAHDLAGGTLIEWSTVVGWWRGINGAPIVLGQWSNEATPWTGSTSESTARVSVTVPGRLVAPNAGAVVAEGLMLIANSSNAKATRLYVGGTQFSAYSISTAGHVRQNYNAAMVCAGARNVQVATLAAGRKQNTSSTVATSGTVDMSTDQTAEIRYLLGNSGDSIKYESMRLMVEN